MGIKNFEKLVYKAEELDPQYLVEFLANDEWWLEQKLDGRRVLMDMSGHFYNKKGAPLAKTDPRNILVEDLENSFTPDTLLDGELIGTHFWVFDFTGPSGSFVPFELRRALLEIHVRPEHLIPCMKDEASKTAFALHAMREHLEGVILRDSKARYGRKRALLKVKFKKTADCVVLETGRKGKEAISLALFDGTSWHDVGACSVYGKNLPLDIGDVVEVEYLYATDSNKLYQPVLIRKRDDKYAEECTLDQLQYTNKTVCL